MGTREFTSLLFVFGHCHNLKKECNGTKLSISFGNFLNPTFHQAPTYRFTSSFLWHGYSTAFFTTPLPGNTKIVSIFHYCKGRYSNFVLASCVHVRWSHQGRSEKTRMVKSKRHTCYMFCKNDKNLLLQSGCTKVCSQQAGGECTHFTRGWNYQNGSPFPIWQVTQMETQFYFAFPWS